VPEIDVGTIDAKITGNVQITQALKSESGDYHIKIKNAEGEIENLVLTAD